jgi:urease accessory protein
MTKVSMTSDPAFSLAQWFSPGRPVRAFTFSNRLPWAVESGQLKSDDDLILWIETMLKDGAGFHDSLYLASSYEAKTLSEIAALNELYTLYCDKAGRETEIAEQGAVFARIAQRKYGLDVSPFAYPLAIGYAAAHQSIPLEMTLRFFLKAFASRLLNAASQHMRLSTDRVNELVLKMMPGMEDLARISVNLASKDTYQNMQFLAQVPERVSSPTAG